MRGMNKGEGRRKEREGLMREVGESGEMGERARNGGWKKESEVVRKWKERKEWKR